MTKFRSIATTTTAAFALVPLLMGLTVAPAAHAQAVAASAPDASQGNKAAMPPVDAAASQSGVATKKPSKAGAQSGPVSASGPAAAGDGAKTNKAGKPPTDAAAAESGVATKKPAKAGAQSGPVPAAKQ
jgi:hypothetical protein